MTEPATLGRSLTIDRRRHSALVRDILLQTLASSHGRGRLALVGLAGFAIGLVVSQGTWRVALGSAAVAACAQVVVWSGRAVRALRSGLAVGQTVTIGYAESGDLTVIDDEGQVWLPRGSAMAVVRWRGLATVLGRSVSFVLPGELVGADDVAFLEGHGEPPSGPELSGPVLPLSLEVTQEVQDQVVALATRLVTTSADFLVSFVLAVPMVALFVAFENWLWAGIAAGFYALLAGPGVLGVRRTRRGLRATYAVGRTIRAAVTPEHLLFSTPLGTRQLTWSEVDAQRVTSETVLLRRRRAPLTTTRTEVLPRALFTPADLEELTRAVPRRF